MTTEPGPHFTAIESERLRLAWMSPEFMRASLEGRSADAERLLAARLPEGWPDDQVRERLEVRLDQMTRWPESAPWLLRAMVHRPDNVVVGYINFHDQPIGGKAELGYTVFEEHRRRGYAHEAATAMMRWAHEQHGIRTFVVSISPDNQPSLALAAKLGFVQAGSQIDEIDGLEWVFELDWQAAGSGN